MMNWTHHNTPMIWHLCHYLIINRISLIQSDLGYAELDEKNTQSKVKVIGGFIDQGHDEWDHKSGSYSGSNYMK